MRAVVIGAGRIGCGLVGQALRASGHEVVLVARSRVLVDHFGRVRGYRLRLLDCRQAREEYVEGIRAVRADDVERVVKELADADLVAVCVQPHSLATIAPLIAAGLRGRSRPTNVLAFQNLANAGVVVRRLVASHLPSDWPLDYHGFSGALATRVVSRRLGDPANGDLLTFVADPPPGFVVDARAIRGSLPEIDGLVSTDDYAAAVRQKLYIFSAGHAVAAYLGSLKGYHYIHTAVRDPEIRSSVLGAMAEGRRGLGGRPGTDFDGVESDPIKIIARFDNAALDDPVVRVGRDPLRKLGPRDRLIGAATLAEKAGVHPEKLVLATAAALCFEDPRDPSSVELQRQLRSGGVLDVLKSVCRLEPGRRLTRGVAARWLRLSMGQEHDNLLLSLDRLFWSWASTGNGSTRSEARVT